MTPAALMRCGSIFETRRERRVCQAPLFDKLVLAEMADIACLAFQEGDVA